MKKIVFILACLLLLFVVYESFKKQPELSVEQPSMVLTAIAGEPEPERKLYDLASIETSFNKNFNNIDSIAAHDNKVYYYSKAGMISYGKRSDSWKIDTISYKRLQVNSEKNVDQKIPPMFHRYAYAAVGDRCSINNYEIVLMKFGTEGCYGVSGIFDTVRNTVFYPKEELYKCVAFDNENIYLGQPYGFSIISRDEEIINDYAVLPYLSGESNLHLSGSNVWIASDRIGIQKIDKSNGNELTFWSYCELAGLIDSAEIRKSILEDSQIKFTNFCENDSLLFIGYKVIGDPYFENPSLDGSILLIYHKLKGEWKSIYIDKIKALKLIAIFENKLWLGGNYAESEEGHIEPFCHGGVAVYNIESKELHYFNEIPYVFMVYDIDKKLDETIVYTYDYDQAVYKYRISGDYRIIKVDVNKYEFNNALHNEVKNQMRKKSQSEYSINLNLLRDMKIRLQIVRINKQPVKPHKELYHNPDRR